MPDTQDDKPSPISSETSDHSEPARSGNEPAASIAAPVPARDAALPEDLRVPWDGLDVLLLLVFGFGALVIVALGLQTALSALLPSMEPQARGRVFAVAHQMVWSLLMVGYLAVMIRVRSGAPFWRTIGFRSYRSGDLTPAMTYVGTVAGGALLAVGVGIVSAVLDRFIKRPEALPIEGMFQSRESATMMMVAAIVVAPLAEEILFRGFLYPVVARRLGVALGVLLTGSLFGLMHAGQLWGGWAQIAILMGVGWVLTLVRAQTGSVLASYLLHLGYNALLLLGFYFATGGLKNLPAPK